MTVGRTTDLARGLGVAALMGSLASAPGSARAEHVMSGHHEGPSGLTLGISVEAAGLDNGSYVGSYQGVAPRVSWVRDWFGADATLGLYHLTKNGLGMYGFGDATVGSHATLLGAETVRAGVALPVTVPTGSEPHGFGMGHVMAMPSAWLTWRSRSITVTASAGYCRAITALGGGAHEHAQPLIDPMNTQELTWSTSFDLAVGRGMRVGGRAQGGVPIGAGITRAIGAGRVAWGTPRVSTGLELQLGLAGDPFTIRGVVDTALRF